jgi:predicted transglutaminase-like cysteine proteinase
VAKRHGEQASARLRDVYQFMIVHLNDPVEEQLEAVNDYMNELTWIADSDLWKQPDYWATPFETITTFISGRSSW